MDKYEYRVKTEQMLEHLEKKEYKKAAKAAKKTKMTNLYNVLYKVKLESTEQKKYKN